ncbi:SDR family NAD(P)-dependent oxidoreductase [Streptosporangium carneum]|uniref:Ketoacyl reductase n=1 Tax=Streptosporangium carneum TaxID=47481 RepID=A0A9W6I949_9ACTN|nr:SDR family oxidoreductase [Streptosporangium carneum]GLK13205.1 ketoacyl reductase [Streptosporangium carneum]
MKDTALVTGASSGIGVEFARQLAARGHDLVLVARSVERLESLAEELREAHGVRAEVVGQDLAAPDAATRVAREVAARGLTVGLLVNNAGFGTAGRFEEIPAGREHDELMVNVVSLVGLTHAFIPGMVARGGGAVVNVGSVAGFHISPYLATYAASKTFVLNFSLALWAEFRGRGVKVLAVAPGPVETAFFDVLGTKEATMGARMNTPEQVVRSALHALDRDRGYVVPGRGNFGMAHLMPRRPRKLITLIGRLVTKRVAETSSPEVRGDAAARAA